MAQYTLTHIKMITVAIFHFQYTDHTAGDCSPTLKFNQKKQ